MPRRPYPGRALPQLAVGFAGGGSRPVPAAPPAQLGDTPGGKFCPVCGHFMHRYRIGHGADFSLDRCGTCGRFWLDAGEWQASRACGLPTALHRVSFDAWQSEMAMERRRRAHDDLLQTNFGPADLAEIHRAKAWTAGHPHCAELLAFLLDQGPA